MSTNKIESKFSNIDNFTCEPILIISMQDILSEVSRVMGDTATNISSTDLEEIRNEVLAVVDHDFDVRDYVQPAIEIWRTIKKL